MPYDGTLLGYAVRISAAGGRLRGWIRPALPSVCPGTEPSSSTSRHTLESEDIMAWFRRPTSNGAHVGRRSACAGRQGDIAAHVLGSLGSEEQTRLTAHLRVCHSCRRPTTNSFRSATGSADSADRISSRCSGARARHGTNHGVQVARKLCPCGRQSQGLPIQRADRRRVRGGRRPRNRHAAGTHILLSATLRTCGVTESPFRSPARLRLSPACR